ncbi:hypothetical protein [Wolbachia endosymbiont of Ctenocephalides felis wCfeT]|uniref:hypothetical protein n=1 Tax=Wolbachia endosymbiont of Ctenocephalides felis wCfeT TaxID=2732593 RepID=UPI001447E3BB|nr:hypothetical protein [Wolbachia endosymbiont of Ctenocephalides felis wCfeT]
MARIRVYLPRPNFKQVTHDDYPTLFNGSDYGKGIYIEKKEGSYTQGVRLGFNCNNYSNGAHTDEAELVEEFSDHTYDHVTQQYVKRYIYDLRVPDEVARNIVDEANTCGFDCNYWF